MLKNNKFTADKSSYKTLAFIKQYLQIKRKKSFKFIKSKKKKIVISQNFKQSNFEELLLFYTVVNFGSINLASERLRLSQPAISLSLQKVEQQLGYLLFKKSNSTKFLALSIYGSVIYNYIERIFELFNEVVQFNSNCSCNHLDRSENFIQLSWDQNRPLLLSKNSICHSNNLIYSSIKKCFLFPGKVSSLNSKFSHFKILSADFIELNTLSALEISKSMTISPIFY